MADRLQYPFGTVNTETAMRWMQLAPGADGPVWMLNLMKYKPVADYGDGTTASISGREADDIYAPTAVLDDLGATVPLFGDVTRQLTADPVWERIAIVRYPDRASFFAMQNREDFRKQYVHKEAGMETTIVMGCVPTSAADAGGAGAARSSCASVVTSRGSHRTPTPTASCRSPTSGSTGSSWVTAGCGTTCASTGWTTSCWPTWPSPREWRNRWWWSSIR